MAALPPSGCTVASEAGWRSCILAFLESQNRHDIFQAGMPLQLPNTVCVSQGTAPALQLDRACDNLADGMVENAARGSKGYEATAAAPTFTGINLPPMIATSKSLPCICRHKGRCPKSGVSKACYVMGVSGDVGLSVDLNIVIPFDACLRFGHRVAAAALLDSIVATYCQSWNIEKRVHFA